MGLRIWTADKLNAVSFRFAVGRHANVMDWGRNRILRVGKNSSPILSRLWTKVHEILGQCRGPLVLSNRSCPIVYSMPCFVQKIFGIKSGSHQKSKQMYIFLAPNILGRTTPTFLQKIVNAIYFPPSGKVWLSSVCWSPSVKPGNQVKQNLHRVAKNYGPILSCLWTTKVHDILRRSNPLPRLCVHVSFWRHRPLKLQISCMKPDLSVCEIRGVRPRKVCETHAKL